MNLCLWHTLIHSNLQGIHERKTIKVKRKVQKIGPLGYLDDRIVTGYVLNVRASDLNRNNFPGGPGL